MHPELSHRRGSSEPTGPLLRGGVLADAEAIEAVHYASREAVYAGRVADWPPPGPDQAGRIRRWQEWLADPEVSTVVAEAGGEVVGFCTIRRSQDEDVTPSTAEMPTLYVRPDYWHRGLGRTLCGAGVDLASGRGFDTLTLWVLEMNRRARRFYEAFGFVADGARKVDELTTERLVALRYRMPLSADAAG